jgi:hypothetical protein
MIKARRFGGIRAADSMRFATALKWGKQLVSDAAKVAVVPALLLSAVSPLEAVPTVNKTAVTIYKPEKAYKSYIAFSAFDGKTHLVDMAGKEVHTWNYVGLPGAVIDPALVGGARGHTLLQIQAADDQRGGIFGNKTVGEVDWNGKIVWEWGSQAPDGAARQNHDWARLPNGNTLLLITRPRVVPALGSKVVGDQGIYEVSPDGHIVWQWMASDHLDEFGLSAEGMQFLRDQIAADPDTDPWGYFEINNMHRLGANKWFEEGDARFDPDNIMIDSRKANFIVIISKKTGKIVWRMGPYYEGGRHDADHRLARTETPRPVDQLAGQHNAHLIPEGLPGAGNILVLDNQGGSGYPPVALGVYAASRVLEINPVTKQIVWQYTAADSGRMPWTFFTSFVGSVQRLPNGNTLINEGMNGRIFQVTASGEIVWEYVNPYAGMMKQGDRMLLNPMIYRAQAVPYDWVPAGVAQ